MAAVQAEVESLQLQVAAKDRAVLARKEEALRELEASGGSDAAMTAARAVLV